MFIAFTGYKFLQNLRNLGFQTFGNVIDESYDLIEDDTKRYLAAFEQVKYLCDADQSDILEKIKPTVEHNYNSIMNTDWNSRAANQITDTINCV